MLTIYKTFVRSHLDYAGKTYDKRFNNSFKEKFEKVQYSAAFISIGSIKTASRERMYNWVLNVLLIEGGATDFFSFIK